MTVRGILGILKIKHFQYEGFNLMADVAIKQETRFIYRDYLTWPDNERWEIINGIPYAMSPAPIRKHQAMIGELYLQNNDERRVTIF